MKTALALLIILLGVQPLYAETVAPSDVPFLECFEAVSQKLAIPMPVTVAIAKKESGFAPWALNIEGQSFHFASKGEALEKARAAQREGRSFDVGLMQINRWWLDRYDISLETALDPLANIYFGSWIFKQELLRLKDLRAAIGAYHSPNPLRASRYAAQIMKALDSGPVSHIAAKPTAAKHGLHINRSMKVRNREKTN